MKGMTRLIATALVALSTTACYHAVIETGATAGTDKLTVPWAHSFIYGLVPPAVVNSAQKCPRGAAKVETQHTFIQGLVAAVTWGIYTPMQIDVTCATGGGRDDAAATLSAGTDPQGTMQQAVELAKESGKPVIVQF